jgi:NAD(P)-dependent dehydrogenase (short-subunit alcohol dehydrogenase family)
VTTTNRLAGRVAIVTGAGRGIGQGIAWRFAEEGALVVVVDIASAGEATAARILAEGGKAIFIQADTGDAVQIQVMVGQVREVFGNVDILVNNAAIQYLLPLWELPEEQFDAMLRTNLKGYYLCMKNVLPHMIQQRKGNVINLASNLAFRALERFSGYSATKGGIVSMSRTAALEAAPYGIRVNCICPGSTITPIMDPLLAEVENPQALLEEAARRMPVGRLGIPGDVANLAVFLASDESEMVLGATYVIDGGASIRLGTA